jgi:hypothetical protein
VVENSQTQEGLHDYSPGDVLMIHLDLSRTPYKFMKVRRKFNALGIFQRYIHGNVECRIFKSGFEIRGAVEAVNGSSGESSGTSNSFGVKVEKSILDEEDDGSVSHDTVIIPIYYTKFIAPDVDSIPRKYLKYFS